MRSYPVKENLLVHRLARSFSTKDRQTSCYFIVRIEALLLIRENFVLDKLTILNSEIQLSGTALYVIFDPHLIYQFIVSHRMQGS